MSTRPNRALAVVIGGILVLAVVAAVVAVTRPATTFSRATPEGIVQAYLSAVLERDNEKAAQFLAPSSGCDVQDLDRAYVQDSARVDLVDTTITGDSARVDVRVTISSGGGPFESSYPEDHAFRLARSGERWLIAGVPWPLYDCGDLR